MPESVISLERLRFTTPDGQALSFLAGGPEDGPLMVFVHGWPELAISWRHQLPVFAGLGFRVVAPDLRGYGESGCPDRLEDYRLEALVADKLALLDYLGYDRAIWVGHDWGAAVVWSVASHHPQRCQAVANLCVPYCSLEMGLEWLVSLVDRSVYHEDEYPAGQWEYQMYYRENFARACAVFDANPYNTAQALFRKWGPEGINKPAITACVRKDGGWFRGADQAPPGQRDDEVLSEQDLQAYAQALERNGFFGPCAYYMNHQANAAYARQLSDDGFLDMPTLFLNGLYDHVCYTVGTRLADPMREYCRDLTWRDIHCGHWMAQEKPREVNACLARWLAESVPGVLGS